MLKVTILRDMPPLWIATPHTILIDELIRVFTYGPIIGVELWVESCCELNFWPNG
jgi:hypothetical protein